MKYIYDDRTQQKLEAIDKRMNVITEGYMKVLNRQLEPYLNAKAKIIASAVPKKAVWENPSPEEIKPFEERLKKFEEYLDNVDPDELKEAMLEVAEFNGDPAVVVLGLDHEEYN